MNTDNVTRVEVIDHRDDGKGRVFVVGPVPVTVKLSLQDDGRTLKVFLSDGHKKQGRQHG